MCEKAKINKAKPLAEELYKPVKRSARANVNRRILCGLFSIVGLLIMTTQNREFNRNDTAAITPYTTSLAKA